MAYSLSELSDRQDIVDLLAAYCRAIDDNRPEDVVSLFTDDCYLDYGEQFPIVEGRTAATKFVPIGTASINFDFSQNGGGGIAHRLIFSIGQSLRRRYSY